MPSDEWITEDEVRERLAFEDPVELDAALEAMRAGLNDRFTFHVQTRTSPPRVFQVSGAVRYGADGQPRRLLGLAHDTTRLVDAEAAAATATGAFDVAVAPQLVMDDDGVILDANEAFLAFAGRERDQLVGRRARQFRADREKDDAYVAEFWPTLRRTGVWSGTIPVVRADGTPFDATFVIRRLALPGTRPRRYLCSVIDGDAFDATRDRRIAELSAMVHVDPLTGLPNRAVLFERLRAELASGRPVAVLFVDLDGFKLINDAHGHGVGDLALREIGERLQASVRGSDIVARLGGDEFAFLTPASEQTDHLASMADRAIARIVAPLESVPSSPNQVGASFGIALAPGDGTEADVLLRHADTAMYRAKARGGNTWVPWDPDAFGLGSDTHRQLGDDEIEASDPNDA